MLLRRRVVGSDARRGQIQRHSGGAGLDSDVMPEGVRSVGPTAVLCRTAVCVRREQSKGADREVRDGSAVELH